MTEPVLADWQRDIEIRTNVLEHWTLPFEKVKREMLYWGTFFSRLLYIAEAVWRKEDRLAKCYFGLLWASDEIAIE